LSAVPTIGKGSRYKLPGPDGPEGPRYPTMLRMFLSFLRSIIMAHCTN